MNPFIFHQVYRTFNNLPSQLQYLKGKENLLGLFDIPNQISEERKNIYKTIYNGIGETGCYTVNLPNNNLLRIKMEYANSMGNSHYSRYWIPYLFIAESLNLISPNKTKIIEVSSGSAGIALAVATKELGFHTTIVVPKSLPKNRLQPMIESRAELIRVDGYIDKCVEELKYRVEQNGFFPTNHSEEKSDFIVNVFSRIAAEYLNNYNFPDYAIIGLGNGTTTYAIFSEFKNRGGNTLCISYNPDLTKKQLIYGLYGPHEPNFNLRHIKLADSITSQKMYTNAIDLTEVEEYFKYDTEISNLGSSSKYGIAIAFSIAKIVKEKTFLTIGYDKNDRY